MRLFSFLFLTLFLFLIVLFTFCTNALSVSAISAKAPGLDGLLLQELQERILSGTFLVQLVRALES